MLIPEGNVNLIPEFSKNIFRKNRVVCFQTTFHSFQSKNWSKRTMKNDSKKCVYCVAIRLPVIWHSFKKPDQWQQGHFTPKTID